MWPFNCFIVFNTPLYLSVSLKWTNKKKHLKNTFIARQFHTLFEQKFSNLRPLLSITFPQGFRISKKFGYWTSGSGGQKSEWESLTERQTNRQQTNIRTFWLIESIGPEGWCFENPVSKAKFDRKTFFFCVAILYPLWAIFFSNQRPLLSIIFPQGS